jgi:ribosomal protein L14E/L6E/L27E
MEYYHVKNNNKNKTLKNCVYFQIIGETKKCYKIEINGNEKRRIRMSTLNKIEYTIESFKPKEQNEIKNEIEKLKYKTEIEKQEDGFVEKNILSDEMENTFF